MNENQTPYEQMQAAQHQDDNSIMEATERAMQPQTVMEAAEQEQAAPTPKAKRQRKPARKPSLNAQAPQKPVGKTQRRKRIPVSQRQTQATPTRAGFHRRWVTDDADRIQMYEEGGYTKVLNSQETPWTRRGGAGKMQFLMEIEKELHDEDQKIKWEQMNKNAQERLKPREGMKGYYQPKTKHEYT